MKGLLLYFLQTTDEWARERSESLGASPLTPPTLQEFARKLNIMGLGNL